MNEQAEKGKNKIPRKSDGTVLTLEDLPPATWAPGVSQDKYFWRSEDKANVVSAVNTNLISRDEAFERYRLSPEEYATWEKLVASHGRAGLHARSLRAVRSDKNMDRKRETIVDQGEPIKTGPFLLFPGVRRVTCGTFEEYLTPQQWKVFSLFISHKGTVVPHNIIKEQLPNHGTVNSTVGRLNEKLSNISGGKKWIENRRGKGWIYTGWPVLDL
ncbi:DUF1153 domain-containing protein [Candidatus Kaiserbacteria bacterium]|nr:DUF1153 domain-containing protein [Candidatus Kaiserbacteria bacterium]